MPPTRKSLFTTCKYPASSKTALEMVETKASLGRAVSHGQVNVNQNPRIVPLNCQV